MRLRLLVPGVVLLAGVGVVAVQRSVVPPPMTWPVPEWARTTPEAQGLSSGDLAAALEHARSSGLNIHSLAVIRNGFLVLDAYFPPFESGMRHDVASVTKSITSMLVGAAVADGRLENIQQTVVTALPQNAVHGTDPRVATIRLDHLLAMQSGLDCGLTPGEPELRAMRVSPDWIRYGLSLPLASPPGTRFGYCSPGSHLLSAAVATATAMSTLEYARRRLFTPLGISDVHWPADARGVSHGWGDLQLQPLDMARIGLLMLRGGRWRDAQLLPATWVDEAVTPRASVSDDESYGLGWWISGRVPTLFEANGRGGQRITVWPQRNLVIVMTGGGFEPGDLGGFLLKAVRSDDALPDDRIGQQQLANVLQRIAEPPDVRMAPRPPVAAGVSGRTYSFRTNALGIESLTLDFLSDREARLRLRLAGGELVQTLGMDGRYRLSEVEGTAASAGRAEWLEDGRLGIDFNRLSFINRYRLDVEFRDSEILMTASEPTELGTITLRGQWQP